MPTQQRNRSYIVFTLSATLILGSCSSNDPPSALPSGMQPAPYARQTTGDLPGALIEGRLTAVFVNDRAYFLLETEFETYGLIFTEQVFGVDGEVLQLAHEDGSVIASVGDVIGFGGGQYPQGANSWNGGPEVDQYWLAIIRE